MYVYAGDGEGGSYHFHVNSLAELESFQVSSDTKGNVFTNNSQISMNIGEIKELYFDFGNTPAQYQDIVINVTDLSGIDEGKDYIGTKYYYENGTLTIRSGQGGLKDQVTVYNPYNPSEKFEFTVQTLKSRPSGTICSELNYDTEVVTELQGSTDIKWYHFKPDETTGFYIPRDTVYPFTRFIGVYDADMNWLTDEMMCEQGKDYYFSVSTSKDYKDNATYSYSWRLNKMIKATSISLSAYNLSCSIGEELELPTTTYFPENTTVMSEEWSILSGEDGKVTNSYGWFSENSKFSSMKIGKYVLQVCDTYNPSVTARLNIIVTPPKIYGTISNGVTQEGKGTGAYKIVADTDDVYTFSMYQFESTGEYIYNSDFTEILAKDEKPEDEYFTITMPLKAGETYYLVCREDDPCGYRVTCTKEAKDTPEDSDIDTPYPQPAPGIAATSLTIDYKKLKLAKGKSFQLHTQILPENTTDTITWSSSDPQVVSVTQGGKIKALKAGKSATITATTSSGLTVSCKVTVPKKAIKATKVKVKKSTITVKVGKTAKIKATMSPKKTTDNLTYSAKKKSIATVSSTGVITGVKKGKTKVTVKTTSGKKAVVIVIVK